MLEINKNILINSTPQKVWQFLLSLKYSLSMNRSHTKVIVPSDFESEVERLFQIHQNLAITRYIFDSKIINKKPLEELSIYKTDVDNLNFSHTVSYYIKSNNKLELELNLKGNFGSKILELSLKPILYGIVIDELRNIKLAIESSDDIISHQDKEKKLNPI